MTSILKAAAFGIGAVAAMAFLFGFFLAPWLIGWSAMADHFDATWITAIPSVVGTASLAFGAGCVFYSIRKDKDNG